MDKIKFTLTEKAFIDVLLYSISLSDNFKKSRKTSKFLLCSIMLLLGLLFISFDKIISIVFFTISLLAFLFLQKYLRLYYKKYFTNLVKSEEYRNRIGQSYETTFSDDFIEMKNESVEVKHNIKSFQYISETSEYFYIKLNIGDFLIFPKQQIPNIELFKDYLNHICINHNLNYEQEMDWKWK